MKRKPFNFKHYVVVLLCCLYSVGGWGQVNYVLNPSLEIHDTCPYAFDQINYAKHFSSIDSNLTYALTPPYTDGIPEYCQSCASNWQFGVPIGAWYRHYPKTGNGMAQLQLYFDESYSLEYKRDYLQGRFYKPLIANKTYCVTFYVTLEQASQYAINKIGAYIDNGNIDTTHSPGHIQVQYLPQVVCNQIINDTLNWVQIQGSFTAVGNEKFITIGNFTDSGHMAHVPSISGGTTSFTWYLVDDISVIESNTTANAGNDTTIYKGDSILIGESAVPYTWYKRTSTGLILIDSVSGGIWVKPDSTTTYVVKLTLCGVVTWDSIKVAVVPVGIYTLNAYSKTLLYPNPIDNELNIANAPIGTSIRVYDVVGRIVYSGIINAKQDIINTSQWERGSYFVEMVGEMGREVRKVVK